LNPLLAKLASIRPVDGEKVARFAEEHGWPLVQGNQVTFVFYGEADVVNLRHWVFGLPAEQPFTRLPGTPFWFRELALPESSRVEYKFEVVRRGRGEWILDPFNPNRAHDPFGANSVCQAAGYSRPEWTLHDPLVRAGTVDAIEVQSRHLGDRRTVPIYIPARFRKTRRYPLLIVHDGSDYDRYAGMRVVLDNLIDRLEIPPRVVALSNPHDRLREYANDARHADYLVKELVPLMEAHVPTGGSPASRCLMGASFGAVATLSTAWRHQGVFGNLLLQSGSFAFSDIGHHKRSREFDPVADFVNAFRADVGKPASRVYMSCGIYESLIYENRTMLPVLERAGIEVRYAEARDGHNWENWRDRQREGLSWLMPGPLWFTYE
jgi:enterochelin esterase-like enzyme